MPWPSSLGTRMTARLWSGKFLSRIFAQLHAASSFTAGGLNHAGEHMSTFEKRQKEKKRQQKKLEKLRRKEERKANSTDGSLESMMAYVDENGMLTDTPPDPEKRVEIDASEIILGIPPKEVDDKAHIHTGVVDFFDTSKGFGFIKEVGGHGRYFVHVSGLLKEIREGNKVVFELERGPKGMNAVRVDLA